MNLIKLPVFGIAITLLLMRGYAQNPEEWPILHNVHHTSFSPTKILNPPLKLKWAADLLGNFKTGPVVADGKLVIQSIRGYIFCLDAGTGEQLWRHYFKSAREMSAGPCIWNGRVYTAIYSKWPDLRGIHCFDLETGDLLWKKDAGYIGPRIRYSPQVSQGKLFFISNREMTGNTNTADCQWKPQVQAWDALTGDTLWKYDMGNNPCNNTSLVVAGDTVFASVGEIGTNYSTIGGKTVAFDLAGNVLWSSTQYHVSGYVGTIQYLDGKIMLMMADRDNVTIINTADWSVELAGGGGDPYSKVSAVMNGHYYNRGYSRAPYKYNLQTGQEILQCKHSEYFKTGCAPPVAANGYIYQGFGSPAVGYEETSGHFWIAFDESGQEVWKYRASTNLCSNMAIAYHRLYVASCAEGMVYCFENAQ